MNKMKLSKSDVEHIAMLARLRFTDEEKVKFAKQLSSILDYVNKLQEVDTTKAEEIAQITGLQNVYREDKVEECGEKVRAGLLDNVPEREEDLIKTRSVFN